MTTLFFVLEAFVQTIPFRVVGVLLLLFFAVLFLQSAIDKIADRKGNLEWLNGHFSKTIFKNQVAMLLSVLTVMELLSGIGSLLAAIFATFMKFERPGLIPFAVMSFCAFTLLCLFMGQRIAKDYTGAAGIVPYFILAILADFYFMMGLFEMND
jgi:putative oxidoreductase